MTDSPSRARSVNSVARTLSAIAAIVPPAILVVFLVGSLIFSGGQVSASMDPKWGIVWSYPLFPVPAIVLIALAAASIVLALVVAATARAGDVPGIRGLLGPTAAAIVSAIVLSVIVPDGGTRSGDTVIGDQWIAAVLSGVALVILLLGIAVARARSRDRQSIAR